MTGCVLTMTDDQAPGAGRPHSADEALDVQTVVVEEHGRWAVDIVVVFADGVVRKRINTHHTKARADIAADLIRRAAERDIGGGPPHG